MRSIRGRTARRRSGTPVAVGLLAATGVLAVAQPAGPAVTALTAAFLLLAPAVAVVLPLSGLDPLARAVIAVASVLTLDTVVAQTMLAVDAWSLRTGVLAVGGISAALLICLSAWLPGTRGGSRGTGVAAERGPEVAA
ncbi:hypothetical protein ACI78V_02645 [Geodermatophilus sp. SYSU D00742]